MAALCNAGGIFQGARICAEQRFHFFGAFIVKFIGFKAKRAPAGKLIVGLNTHQHRLHFGIRTAQVMAVIGGDQRQIARLRQLYQKRQNLLLLCKTVILNFNVEMIFAEYRGKLPCGAAGTLKIPLQKQLRNLPRKAGGKRNQPLGMCAQQFHIHPRLHVKAFGKPGRYQFDQVAVSDLVFAKQNQMIRVRIPPVFLKAGAGRHIHFATDDRANALLPTGVVKGDRTVHHAVVGQRYGAVPAFLCPLRDLPDAARPVQQAVFAVQMQMNKLCHGYPFPLSAFFSFATACAAAKSIIFCNR